MYIAEEMIATIYSSGLIDNAEFFIYCNYDIDNFKWLESKTNGYANVTLIDHDATPEEYELSTLNELKNYCNKSNESFKVLYLHHKGASRLRTRKHANITDWRNYMMYFNVDLWQDCVSALDLGYDTAGVEWTENPKFPKHYSGNFWWATADYIRSLPDIVRPRDRHFINQSQFGLKEHYRFDAEAWIGLANPHAKSFNNSNIDHYRESYPDHLYRKQK